MGQDWTGNWNKSVQSTNPFFENTWENFPPTEESQTGGFSLVEMFISFCLSLSSTPQEMTDR